MTILKGGIEDPADPANAVPLSEVVCNARPFFIEATPTKLKVFVAVHA